MDDGRYSRLPDSGFRKWIGSTVSLLVVGLGSIGRAFATGAQQLGICRIHAVDPDNVESSDFRAGYGDGAVGKAKVKGFGEDVVRLNSDVLFKGEQFAVNEANRERISKAASGCNVAGLVFDDFENFRVASDMVCPQMPAVAAFVTENLGEVLWSVPAVTPDLTCTADVAQRQQVKGGVAPAYQVQMVALLAVWALEELLYVSYSNGAYRPRVLIPARTSSI